VPQVTPSSETQCETQRRSDDLPPGQFVTDELQSDCTRFLEEIKDVVRRRNEAGLAHSRYA
jgi:hypothetical protein